jgi:hypothetical protein
MGFGSRDAFWFVRLTGAILFMTKLITCCETGTYSSKVLKGCVHCPKEPLLGCTESDVHRDDISSCLKIV